MWSKKSGAIIQVFLNVTMHHHQSIFSNVRYAMGEGAVNTKICIHGNCVTFGVIFLYFCWQTDTTGGLVPLHACTVHTQCSNLTSLILQVTGAEERWLVQKKDDWYTLLVHELNLPKICGLDPGYFLTLWCYVMSDLNSVHAHDIVAFYCMHSQ